MAPIPKVLLLDEPPSALDLKLRQVMRVELKQLQEEAGITFVFVTHDQEEALTMSDRITVMSAGGIQQVGTPHEIYPALHGAADLRLGRALRLLALGGRRGPLRGPLDDVAPRGVPGSDPRHRRRLHPRVRPQPWRLPRPRPARRGEELHDRVADRGAVPGQRRQLALRRRRVDDPALDGARRAPVLRPPADPLARRRAHSRSGSWRNVRVWSRWTRSRWRRKLMPSSTSSTGMWGFTCARTPWRTIPPMATRSSSTA